MTGVQVTNLPGVGVLRTFMTGVGDWIGVLELRSGRRQLFVDDPTDPDTRRLAADLSVEDVRVLTDLLGGHEQDLGAAEDAAALVDWVLVHPDSAAAGRTVADLELRSRTGATIVAVLRDRTYADPGPEFRLEPNDIAILAGGQPALEAAVHLLRDPR